jgi:hypothetical protein
MLMFLNFNIVNFMDQLFFANLDLNATFWSLYSDMCSIQPLK